MRDFHWIAVLIGLTSFPILAVEDHPFAVPNEVYSIAISQIGQRVRTKALLSACGKEGIAKAIDSKLEDPQYLYGILGSLRPSAKITKEQLALSPAERATAVTQALMLIWGYSDGYEEMASLLVKMKGASGAMCDAATRSADDLLNDRPK